MAFRVSEPFSSRPPRLKDLVNEHVMGDVWIRDTPFGPITDTLVLAKNFGIAHRNILRSIDKCNAELANKYQQARKHVKYPLKFFIGFLFFKHT